MSSRNDTPSEQSRATGSLADLKRIGYDKQAAHTLFGEPQIDTDGQSGWSWKHVFDVEDSTLRPVFNALKDISDQELIDIRVRLTSGYWEAED